MHASYTQGNFVVLVTCDASKLPEVRMCSISSKLLSEMVLHVASNKGEYE